jgi:hypothetical protein
MTKSPFSSLISFSLFVLGCGALVACASSSSGTPAPAGGSGGGSASAKLSDIRVHTFNASCAISASCHQGTSAAGGIDLSSARKSSDLIADLKKPTSADPGQGAIAVPGDPSKSFLVHKLEGDLPCIKDQSCGIQMPQTGPKIAADKIQEIQDWIAGGMVDD